MNDKDFTRLGVALGLLFVGWFLWSGKWLIFFL